MESLRQMVIFLKFDEKFLEEVCYKNKEKWKQIVINEKREYRRALRQSIIPKEYTYERTHPDGDSWVTRYDITKDGLDEDENNIEYIRDFVLSQYCIPYFDRGYDCTGQIFTLWFDIFNIKDRYVIYVCNGLDV